MSPSGGEGPRQRVEDRVTGSWWAENGGRARKREGAPRGCADLRLQQGPTEGSDGPGESGRGGGTRWKTTPGRLGEVARGKGTRAAGAAATLGLRTPSLETEERPGDLNTGQRGGQQGGTGGAGVLKQRTSGKREFAGRVGLLRKARQGKAQAVPRAWQPRGAEELSSSRWSEARGGGET